MERIGTLITKRLSQHKLGESAQASEVVYKANQLLNCWLKAEADEVRATQLKNGTLYISVGNSVWNQEVWGLRLKLLREMQSEFGKNTVLKIITKALTLK